MKNPPLAELGWNPAFRLIPSRFPPIGLFDRVARPEQLEVIFALQGLTNPRLRQEEGDISLVPAADRVCGAGSTPIMAAFCHLNPEGSRFSDGSYGVYYGASTLGAAAAEVGHHRSKFFEQTRQPAIDVDMRAYVAEIVQPLHDLRSKAWTSVHAADDYQPGQSLAKRLRAEGSYGMIYRSVRSPGAECVAVLRPTAIKVPVVQGPHVTLRWDGTRISGWYQKSDLVQL